MRRRALVSTLVVAVAAVGCGGSQVSSDEVPGAPPALAVPVDDAAPTSGSTSGDSTGTTTDDATTTDPATTTDDTGATVPDTTTTDPATTTDDATTGAATPEPAPPATAEPAPATGQTDQFEDFCAQNEGAC